MVALRLGGVVLGSPEPRRLATFYEALLGLARVDDEDDWVRSAGSPDERPSLGFQREDDFLPPVWPPAPGTQQMHQHLDIATDDLPAAVDRALELGARLADEQPQDDVRVLFDPDGHVFCLFDAADLFG